MMTVTSPTKRSEISRVLEPTLQEKTRWRIDSLKFSAKFFWQRYLFFITLHNVTCVTVLALAVMTFLKYGSEPPNLNAEAGLDRVEEISRYQKDLEKQLAAFHEENDRYKSVLDGELKLMKNRVDEKLSEIHQQISRVKEDVVDDVRKTVDSVAAQKDQHLHSTFGDLNSLSNDLESLKASVFNMSVSLQSTTEELVKNKEENRMSAIKTRNFASRRNGAYVIESLSSPQYFEDWKKRFYSYIWTSSTHQWPIIDRLAIHPGDAFCFEGEKGVLSIRLSDTVPVVSVRYEHDYWTHDAPLSCPREYDVYTCLNEECSSRELAAKCNYDELKRRPQQVCHVTGESPSTNTVQLEFLSNYGQNYTCIYSVQVFGEVL